MVRRRQEVYVCEDKDGVWQSTSPSETLPEVRRKREGPKPAMTPDGRERQLVDLAVRLAEKQLREGTASSAVIVHYLKLASKREALEREILEKNAKLIEAKAKNIDRDRESEELAKAAMEAMKSYNRG